MLRLLLACACVTSAAAQTGVEAVLERLDKLERQNQAMAEEIRQLRAELEKARAAPTTEERVERNEQRTEDMAQSKVESGQKLPIRITGMALFNAFTNGRFGTGADNPTTAALQPGLRRSGATVRQTIVGLEFHGPETVAGGKLSGTLTMDFFAGTANTLNQLMRVRTGSIQVDWENTTIMVGQQKPIFSPRDPTSLAQVGLSPLTNAGNPWLWQPQIKLEQRFGFGPQSGLRAQVGVFQTNENANIVPPAFASSLAAQRPALQGRFEVRHRGLEIAPGFHLSTTHVAGTSVPSNLASVDWLFAPLDSLRFTGLFYTGANIANMGALRQGFTILGPRNAIAVRGRGGWAQLEWLPTSRLSFHFMHGQHDDRDRDVRFAGFGKNQAWAGNVFYRIAPNVIVAFESAQTRTTYINSGTRRNTHHDLAVAYLF